MTHSDFIRDCLLQISDLGARGFKNDVGMATLQDGSVVRFGLFPGSGDIIGYKSVTITEDMVGKKLAGFVSIEGKVGRDYMKPNQKQWLSACQSAGSFCGEARTREDVVRILQKPYGW
jgi:hypothetical protein